MKTIILALVIACAGVSHAARFGSAADPMYVVSMSTYAYISGEAKVTGNSYFGAELYVTTNTAATGAWAFPATVSVGGELTAATLVGAGSGLTGITAANISAGSLGSSVIASSVAINAVQNASIVGMTASKLTGAIPLAVTVYLSAGCEALTPAAEGEFCYDTTSHIMNASTSTLVGGFSPL